jgi:hypothetical protein
MFSNTFQLEHDECLRELGNVNITNPGNYRNNNADDTASLTIDDSLSTASGERTADGAAQPPKLVAGASARVEGPLEELPDPLDSLNEFEFFLRDLGLEDVQGAVAPV